MPTLLILKCCRASISVSMPACHAGEQGSTPWRGASLIVRLPTRTRVATPTMTQSFCPHPEERRCIVSAALKLFFLLSPYGMRRTSPGTPLRSRRSAGCTPRHPSRSRRCRSSPPASAASRGSAARIAHSPPPSSCTAPLTCPNNCRCYVLLARPPAGEDGVRNHVTNLLEGSLHVAVLFFHRT